MSHRLEILEYSYWEHFKYAKDLQLILPLNHPKRVKLQEQLNIMIEELHIIKNSMSKLEKIQKAYGDYWDLVKDVVNENGYILVQKREDKYDDLFEDIEMEDKFDYELEVCFSRPSSLKDIK